jgi:hypothetical protein
MRHDRPFVGDALTTGIPCGYANTCSDGTVRLTPDSVSTNTSVALPDLAIVGVSNRITVSTSLRAKTEDAAQNVVDPSTTIFKESNAGSFCGHSPTTASTASPPTSKRLYVDKSFKKGGSGRSMQYKNEHAASPGGFDAKKSRSTIRSISLQ